MARDITGAVCEVCMYDGLKVPATVGFITSALCDGCYEDACYQVHSVVTMVESKNREREIQSFIGKGLLRDRSND